ncbi:hypothetical protein SNE40_016522 [Patella caerulea]
MVVFKLFRRLPWQRSKFVDFDGKHISNKYDVYISYAPPQPGLPGESNMSDQNMALSVEKVLQELKLRVVSEKHISPEKYSSVEILKYIRRSYAFVILASHRYIENSEKYVSEISRILSTNRVKNRNRILILTVGDLQYGQIHVDVVTGYKICPWTKEIEEKSHIVKNWAQTVFNQPDYSLLPLLILYVLGIYLFYILFF